MDIRFAIRDKVRGYVRDTYLAADETAKSEGIIDCSTGFSQWGMSPRAAEAHFAFDPSELTAYSELSYDRLLKPVIMQKFGLSETARGRIFFGHGSFNLAERLIHKMIKPFRMVGPGPQFNEIPSEFVAAGGEYRPVPIKAPDYEFPLEQLERSLVEGASVLYLDNPNNPLGRLVGLEVIAELAEAASQGGAILMVDEAYGDFVEDSHSAIHLISDFPNLAVLRSCSKALGLASARIGYMVLSEELAAYYRPLDVPFEPSLYSAVLAEATLKDAHFIQGVRTKVKAGKKIVVEKLASEGCIILPTHESTSIFTVQLPGGRSWKDEANTLGIAVELGSAFEKTHPGWNDSYCRFRLPGEAWIGPLVETLGLLSAKV